MKFIKNDPVRNCKLYKDKGCSHIDGILCDFPNCSMNKEYIEKGKKTDDKIILI